MNGGGPHISKRVKELGGKTVFHEGIRVTDAQTLQVVSEELGKLNAQIVDEIKALRGDVTGLKGQQCKFAIVRIIFDQQDGLGIHRQLGVYEVCRG